MKFNLNTEYSIQSSQIRNNLTKFTLFLKTASVGCFYFLSDQTDVGCVILDEMHETHLNTPLAESSTLGETLIKLPIRHLTPEQKLNFYFILDQQRNWSSVSSSYFSHHTTSNANEYILARKVHQAPQSIQNHPDILFQQTVSEKDLPQLHRFLKRNAPWQADLSLNQLSLLVKHSCCFIAFQKEEIIGFARVLSDHLFFASLWDVVVKPSLQNQGIGTLLIYKVLIDPALINIKNWLLYTNSATNLYQKFGFSEIQMAELNLLPSIRCFYNGGTERIQARVKLEKINKQV